MKRTRPQLHQAALHHLPAHHQAHHPLHQANVTLPREVAHQAPAAHHHLLPAAQAALQAAPAALTVHLIHHHLHQATQIQAKISTRQAQT